MDGDAAAARATWDEALAADPANATALNNRGNLALLAGQPDSALAFYARAVAIEKDPGTILNQGLAEFAKGDGKAADARFSQALALLPNPAAAERLLALPPAPAGVGSARRLSVEEIRERLRLAAERVPRALSAAAESTGSSAAERGRTAPKVLSKVSGARASDVRSNARVVYWKGEERGSK
jgi:Tfp pilus assembly protein PilF